MDPVFRRLGHTGHGDLDPHTASAPLPPGKERSAPPRTANPGHADAHTHLVREAPEVSHVPADPTGPS